MGAAWDAAAPLAIDGAIVLLVSPTLSGKVKKDILAHFKDLKVPVPAAVKPNEVASVALWSIDKYSCLLQILVAPAIGLLFLSDSFTGADLWAIFAVYALTGLAMYFVYRQIKKRTPAAYAIDCVGMKIPKVGRIFKPLPVIKKTSWGVLSCAGLLFITAGFSAVLVTVALPSKQDPSQHAPIRHTQSAGMTTTTVDRPTKP